MSDTLNNIFKNINYQVGNFSLANIFSAVITFIICFFIIKAVMKIADKIIAKTGLNNTFAGFIRVLIKVILYFIAIIIAADMLGIPVTSLLAVFSVLGLAVSLSVQTSLSNVAGGLTVLGTKPFIEGDYIETASVSGTVKEIGLFYTIINTPDNKLIYIPNAEISQSKIINYTHEQNRRIDIKITASYNDDINTVEKSLLQSANSVDSILKDQELFAGVINYGSSSVEYVVRAWVKTENYWPAYFELMKRIKYDFDKNGIEMTYDHVNVHMIN